MTVPLRCSLLNARNAGIEPRKLHSMRMKYGKSHTEIGWKACTWLREVCYCSCLPVLPGPAWVLLNKICILFSRSLYTASQFFPIAKCRGRIAFILCIVHAAACRLRRQNYRAVTWVTSHAYCRVTPSFAITCITCYLGLQFVVTLCCVVGRHDSCSYKYGIRKRRKTRANLLLACLSSSEDPCNIQQVSFGHL